MTIRRSIGYIALFAFLFIGGILGALTLFPLKWLTGWNVLGDRATEDNRNAPLSEESRRDM